MIQIDAIHITEFRGIRDLTLTLGRSSFVVSGPNGSGKSGVVDAIQFALTGEIGRLKGAGTGDLTLSEHGPHVEKRGDPEAASVRLDVYVPHLHKAASITRTIKKAKHPKITPDDAAIRAVFAELAQHPETTLSRREIIKFILTEATQRSRDVQTLLKLDDIDQTRATLKTTENKLNIEYSAAKGQADVAEDSLKRHLDLPALKAEDLLATVNKQRKVLGLAEIQELEKDTDVSEGLPEGVSQADAAQNKESALADVKALSDALTQAVGSPIQDTIKSLLEDIATLEENPTLLPLIKRQWHQWLRTSNIRRIQVRLLPHWVPRAPLGIPYACRMSAR